MTLVERLAAAVDELPRQRRVLVAVDGPDAAGKTTLADAVARQTSRPSLRVPIDDWHNPREVRLRRGGESPVGYYLGSFRRRGSHRSAAGAFSCGSRLGLHRSLRLRGGCAVSYRTGCWFTHRGVAALYREEASPLDVADIVIDNSDERRPRVLRWLDSGC